MKFLCTMSNRSKGWNLSAKYQGDDMREKAGVDYKNVEIWVPKWGTIKALKFQCKMTNWSQCWNLSAKYQIDQNGTK